MIARSILPLTLRGLLDRGGLAATLRRIGRDGGRRLSHWKRKFAALGDWPSVSDRAGRGEILLRDRTERFRRFCPDCGEDTAHEGFDELGAGWYAQICRCRLCGRQDMKVWGLTCW
ncbi:MAG TPA: hypothetical protein VN849_03140 [Stellaceae bacterium]|jgi:hypothetical protein|nr:hypothetical protein [Stellaceae bacterium]